MNFIFPVILAVVLAWGYSDLIPFGSEITDYRTTCVGYLKNGECMGIEKPLTPTIYKSIVEQQSVVYWLKDNGAPQRLQSCTVRDARNWLCKPDDNTGTEWKMTDGNFDGSSNHTSYPVSKIHWWWVYITD